MSAQRLRVTALLFAQYRHSAGADEIDLELDAGATVRSVADELEARFGEALSLRGAMTAVNERYERPDRTLDDGDRVAFLPPLSGG